MDVDVKETKGFSYSLIQRSHRKESSGNPLTHTLIQCNKQENISCCSFGSQHKKLSEDDGCKRMMHLVPPDLEVQDCVCLKKGVLIVLGKDGHLHSSFQDGGDCWKMTTIVVSVRVVSRKYWFCKVICDVECLGKSLCLSFLC